MKIKPIFCCLMSAILASTIIFAGCNKNNQEETSSQTEQSSAVSSQSSAENSSENSNEAEKSSQESQEENSAEESSEQEEKISPTVWRVTDSDGNYIYMMGTIHAADNMVYNTPDYYEAAYADSDAIAVECDVTAVTNDLSSSFELLKRFMYEDKSTIDQHISKETYDAAVKILTDSGMYSPLYDYYKPYLWVSLMDAISLQKSGLDTNSGVDTVMINRARNDNKEVIEIESVEFQEELLINFPDEIQNLLLKEYTQNFSAEEAGKSLNELYEHWKNGTLTEEIVNDEDPEELAKLTEDELAAYNEYNKQMLTDRNKVMSDKALEYMQSNKTVMFMVGAAHYYGDEGIIKLMENAGCKFEVLTNDNINKKTESEESTETSSEESSDTEGSENTEAESKIEEDPNAARAA